MKKVLITICFEYTIDKLHGSVEDINNVKNVSSFDTSILFTDIKKTTFSYDEVFYRCSIKSCIDEISKYDNIDSSIFLYIAGHGVVSGFLWHDMSIISIDDLFSSIFTSLLCIVDICNGPLLRLPYVYDQYKRIWKFGAGKSKDATQIFFVSSVTGIHSKMDALGSVYSRNLYSNFVTDKSIATNINNIYRSHPLSRIFCTNPCSESLQQLKDILICQ